MFPWGALLSLAGTGLSAGLSAANNKRAKEEQEAEYARQQAHYNAKANENPLARSENQQVLNQYDRKAQQQVENARNVAKITGATPEYSLAVQKGVAQGRADLMGDIAAGASKQRDKYEDLAETSRQNQAAAQQAYRQQRNEQFTNLAANAASTFGSIVDSYAAPKDSTPQQQKAPAQKYHQQLATGTAVKTSGVDVGNLHVAQDGTVTNNLDPMRRAAEAAVPTPKLSVPQPIYVPNGDGTYTTKDGGRYIKNPDGTYRITF